MTQKIGLVLEGGGMRGLYTAGILDALLDNGVQMDYGAGVSAGACNGVSYVSGQRGRSFRVNTEFLKDPRYLSFHSFLKTRSLFGMDFIFREIPERLIPFDYDAFLASSCEFHIGVTDVRTGKPRYFDKSHMNRQCTVLMASSSLPLFSPPVEYEGKLYLDGGVTDPIPVKKALADGCDKVIVILTRPRGFIKKPEAHRGLYTRLLKKWPAMVRALDMRHDVYNQTLLALGRLELEGRALVLAPSKALSVSRFEKKLPNLKQAYDLGYADCLEAMEQYGAAWFPTNHSKKFWDPSDSAYSCHSFGESPTILLPTKNPPKYNGGQKERPESLK